MKRAALAALLLAGCATSQSGQPPRNLVQDCLIAQAVYAGFAPVLAEKCNAAKDPVKDGYCLGMAAASAALDACFVAASSNDTAGVDVALRQVRMVK